MAIDYLLGCFIAALLLTYLLYVLINAEKF
jgi:K+-transporting ATPase KdpF subunit